jgi:UDP-N-acetylmuramate dehydrogenase
MEILAHYPLKDLNTFGIEAYADEFIEILNEQDLLTLIREKPLMSNRHLILDGGSNLLFTGDFHGLVLKIGIKGKKILQEDENEVHLKVAAGEDWDDLVEYCVGKGWGGLENLSGIPGQVGSSPIQNIGAYGTELKDHFVFLEAFDLEKGEKLHFDRSDCQFAYRDSIFKRGLKGRVLITQVVFRLDKKPSCNLSYAALRQNLDEVPEAELNLRKIREAVLSIRASKLPDPEIIGNAGSFFKNPVVSGEILGKLKEQFPELVFFESQDNYKLAAGWLIEQCGWKGYCEGDAGVHKDQALVIVNYGDANGLDILKLANKIQQSVMDRFGIRLEREVNVI